MTTRDSVRYEFGHFCLDAQEHLLIKDGVPVTVPPKIFSVLLLLVKDRGRLLDKTEIMTTIWPGVYVEEATVTRTISEVRKVLGEGGGKDYILTVPKRGYRFVGPVEIKPEPVPTGNDALEVNPPRLPVSTSIAMRIQKVRRKRLLLGACIVAILALSVLLVAKEVVGGRQKALRSVAVLPFKRLGNSGGVRFMELGMLDTLITRLSRLSELDVRPTGEVSKYVDVQQDPIAVGRALGVDAVLDGSVQQMNDTLRVSVRLIRVRDAKPLWAASFDEKSSSFFALQDAVSEDVANALVSKLTSDEKHRLLRHSTEDPAAYQAYTMGRFYYDKRSGEGMVKSIAYFETAVNKDPSYAMAYASMSDAYIALGAYDFALPSGSFLKAKLLAQKALQLDPGLAEAHATLGLIATDYDMDWGAAEKEYKFALQLDPNCLSAHHWYGEYLSYMERFDEGIVQLRRALEIDPVSLILNVDYARSELMARRYDQGIGLLQSTLEMDPNFLQAHLLLARAYNNKGLKKEGLHELELANHVEDSATSQLMLAASYADAGDQDAARLIIKDELANERHRYVSPYQLGLVYLALRQYNDAMTQLESAFNLRDAGLIALKADPLFDPLRSEPRFQTLMKRLNF
jgi:DNA-binding winged helix-turn-helix (wHTH) protein/TolB-like protein/tetratricopeptide (TPR) repeat protein